MITTHWRIGIDTGGTFTDFLAVGDNRILSFKIPSTPSAPAQAILAGLSRIIKELGGAAGSAGIKLPPEIVHGTTVATNALLERKGARTALVTTTGFEDIIEIGRQARPDLYNLAAERPAPLVPPELRFGVLERIGSAGETIAPLDREQVLLLAGKISRAGAESVAISLLFSFANPTHERALAAALAPLGLPLSISHQLLPEYREYERTSTVVINAYLAPKVSHYLGELQIGLKRLWPATKSRRSGKRTEVSPRLRIMQSSGGSISAEVAAREPVRTILSGPAGGVVAATRVAAQAGFSNVLTFDMGGTSTDVALCRGAAAMTHEARVAGLPVAVPVLDIHTVGAGGGSIAEVDAGGALRVGPESAGARPGPACYGFGERATVTDANVVLGRFGGGGLLSGTMELDAARAAAALDELARQMSHSARRVVSRYEAALGVIRVANANMERALRLVSVERGHDPRRFTLVSFGGAGGLHAAELAAALRLPQVLIPAYPGAFSALGVLLADVVKDYSQTVMLKLNGNDGQASRRELLARFVALEKEALQELRREGFARSRLTLRRALALRYGGQSFEIEVEWPTRESLGQALAAFHRAHEERYGHADLRRPVEIVSVRLKATGLTEQPELPRTRRRTHRLAEPRSLAELRLSRHPQRVPVYERGRLKFGMKLQAPALIVEYGSTTLLPPGWQAKVDAWENLLLSRAERINQDPGAEPE